MPITLQLVAAGAQLRTFAAAITFLGKCGKEITLQGHHDMTALRALNDSHSAFAAVVFERAFFEDYCEPEEPVKVKFSAKAIAQVFKSLRNVERMRLYFTEQNHSHFMVVRFDCKHDISRIHSMSYEDHEVLSAVFDRSNAPHHIISRPAMLARLLDHIRGTQEVSFIASATEARVQSFHHDDASTVNGALHTAMSMAPSEFDRFVMELPAGADDTAAVDVTFSMHEAKALLAFAEDRAVNANEVALFFVGHAHPVLLSTEGVVRKPFHADLVLATLERSVQVRSAVTAAAPAAAVVSAPASTTDVRGEPTTMEEEIAAADLLAFGMMDDEFMMPDAASAAHRGGSASAAAAGSVDSATLMQRFVTHARDDAAAAQGFIHDVSGITPIRADESLSGGRMLELSGTSAARASTGGRDSVAAYAGGMNHRTDAAASAAPLRTPHVHVAPPRHAALQTSLALSPELTSTAAQPRSQGLPASR